MENKLHIKNINLLNYKFSLAKKSNAKFYIVSFDIAKAFDKVSRLLLLKKLVKLGIG